MASAELTKIDSVAVHRTLPLANEIRPHIQMLASLMDDCIRIPGTNWSFGLDGVIGLVPVVGDLVGVVVGGAVIREAERLGVPTWTKARMYGNYLIDFLIGIVPIVGDAFDFGFKAHRRNLRLLQEHVDRRLRSGTPWK